MALAPQDFWPKDDSSEFSVLSDSAVQKTEQKLECKLPALLIELLKFRNGGETRGFVFASKDQTSWAPDHVPFDRLNGIEVAESENPSAGILYDTLLARDEWGVPEKLVALEGDGHWWLALDYRDSVEPAVTWFDTECEEDIRLAPTFEAFLFGLRPSSHVCEDAGVLKENVGKDFGSRQDEYWLPDSEWNCPKCGEIVPESFAICWNCNEVHPDGVPAENKPGD